jgi:hypothetical protein
MQRPRAWLDEILPMTTELQRNANLRMAWTLAAIAAVFGLGFFLRVVLFGG